MRSYGFQITAEDIIDAGYLINKEISFDEAEEMKKQAFIMIFIHILWLENII